MRPRIVLPLAAVLTVAPGMALAAGGEGQGAVSRVLFALGVLLLAANLGGLAAERLGQPPVLGELVIGIAPHQPGRPAPRRRRGRVCAVRADPSDPGRGRSPHPAVRRGARDRHPRARQGRALGPARGAHRCGGAPDARLGSRGLAPARQPAGGAYLRRRHAVRHQRRHHRPRAEGPRQDPEPGGPDHSWRGHPRRRAGPDRAGPRLRPRHGRGGRRASLPPRRRGHRRPRRCLPRRRRRARPLPLEADRPARRPRGPSGDHARGRPLPVLHAGLCGRADRPRRDHRSVRGRAHPGPVRRRRAHA